MERGTESAACILIFRQTASVDIFTQTSTHMEAFSPLSFMQLHTHSLRSSCRLTSLLTANRNGWKEASGHPVEISHLIALHLQVVNVGFRQEQGLLSKPCTVRIHKAGVTHTAVTRTSLATETWASPPPVISCCRGYANASSKMANL